MFSTGGDFINSYGKLQRRVKTLKEELSARINKAQGRGADADEVIKILSALKSIHSDIVVISGSYNLPDLPSSGVEGPIQGLSDLENKIREVLVWAKDHLPTDGQYLLLYTVNSSFQVVPREFTPSALAPLLALLIDLMDFID